MSYNLKNRSFLKEIDFEPRELRFLLKLSEALKLAKYAGTETRQLSGKEIALIFEKTSTRTRSAFEVASYDQGAHVTYLDPSGSQLGHKESIADTAAVLGRMYDAIEFRGNAQADVEELAAHAGGARPPASSSTRPKTACTPSRRSSWPPSDSSPSMTP
jgi:ornithine carbamoyltransferase